MNFSEWWQQLRFDVMTFGLFGAILGFALKPTRKFALGFAQVFGGWCTAMVGTPIVNHLWPIPSNDMYAGIAFLIGLSGLGILRGLPKILVPALFKLLEVILYFNNPDSRGRD
jgi:hypothetical protein